jgi:LAO/AO transport system kinase
MILAASVLEGNRLALARLLTQIENDSSEGQAALSELFPRTGQAHLIGVTGAPGTGKSTLVNQLARFYRQQGDESERKQVGIVAVDPSSPFTGGAILGDRVRMRDLAGDPGVFIRSMASRGSLGGLARATAGIVQAMDAAGYDLILIETVGAGQAEVDIARLAHTTIVIEAPGLGDDIQAIKAGIMEIADLLVINKADRPGVDATERALRGSLQLAHPVEKIFRHHGPQVTEQPSEQILAEKRIWSPPILRVVATEGTGVQELAQAIQQHRQFLEETGGWQRRERVRLQSELDTILQAFLVARWHAKAPDQLYQQILDKIVARELSPWQAVQALLNGGAA